MRAQYPTPLLPRVQPLDLALLAELPTLPLRARFLVHGWLSGRHRSPLKGSSVEFVEYRSYQPGDELRHVDWRLYGRADRLHIKQFEEETQLRLYLLLDSSASMSYASRAGLLTKLDYARTVLAATGQLAMRQRDAVGVALLSEELSHCRKPGSSLANWRSILATLETILTGKKNHLAASLESLAELLPRRAMLVVASDFYEDVAPLRSALERLRYDQHEVLGLQILDPMEVDFADDEAQGTYLDLEGDGSLVLSPTEIRESYLQEFNTHQRGLRDLFTDVNSDFVTLRTDANPLTSLAAYVALREHLL